MKPFSKQKNGMLHFFNLSCRSSYIAWTLCGAALWSRPPKQQSCCRGIKPIPQNKKNMEKRSLKEIAISAGNWWVLVWHSLKVQNQLCLHGLEMFDTRFSSYPLEKAVLGLAHGRSTHWVAMGNWKDASTKMSTEGFLRHQLNNPCDDQFEAGWERVPHIRFRCFAASKGGLAL